MTARNASFLAAAIVIALALLGTAVIVNLLPYVERAK